MHDHPPYPVGLRLAGRPVVMVGAGHVAQRRVPALLAAGAVVTVVSPEATPSLEAMADAGELTWLRRRFVDADLDDAWYVVAATDDPVANTAISEAADVRRIFCARADDAVQATAWTAASGRHADAVVAVLSTDLDHRDPRRVAALRDDILESLREGVVGAPHFRGRTAGVVLVGGGPGDPELMTVAARKALMEADVVVADRLAPRELLGDLPSTTELVDVAKIPRGRFTAQEAINDLIVSRALEGKRVVRFKGGDPFVFGRGYEEVLACREAGVPVTVVPGLTSPVAVPALAGIPVTHRGVAHEFTVVSGHLPPGHEGSLVDWSAMARLTGTLLLMMAVENAGAIAAVLVDGGRAASTPVAVVCDGSMPAERTVLTTLGDLGAAIEAEGVRAPAIIVVGEVVRVAHPDHRWSSPPSR
jgi:uroporphyrin-III C-methyltransferase/precorrin-2 dehydrogenase/sirohydrochlorin ferrochelatase